mgnify:CR=1 FL=1
MLSGRVLPALSLSSQVFQCSHAQGKTEDGRLNPLFPFFHHSGQAQLFFLAQEIQIAHIPQVEVHGIIATAKTATVCLTPVAADAPVILNPAALDAVPQGGCSTVAVLRLCFTRL